jgi:hypothetical protein
MAITKCLTEIIKADDYHVKVLSVYRWILGEELILSK